MVSHRESEEPAMVKPQPMTCTLVRVTRRDTVLVRTYCPMVQSMLNVYIVLEGVKCRKDAAEQIEKWCEFHAENDQLKLVVWQWFRDSYGRILGDLADISSGECLTDYLIDCGAAIHRPDHYIDILREAGGDPC